MVIIIIYMVMNKSNVMQENFYQSSKRNSCSTELPNNQLKYNSGFYNGQRLAKFYYRACLSSIDNTKWDNAYVLGTFDGLKKLTNYYHAKLNKNKNLKNKGKDGEMFERKDPGIKCSLHHKV